MLISRSNISRRLSGVLIEERWNNRSGRNFIGDHGFPARGGGSSKFIMMGKTTPTFTDGHVSDDDRNLAGAYTDVRIGFDDDVSDASLNVGGTATGHTISVNGSAQTTTYRSGSDSCYWTFRVPVYVDASDVITYSYSQSAGNTLCEDDNAELGETVSAHVNNYTTKRIRFVIRSGNNAVYANGTVKLALFSYASGVLAERWSKWMGLEQAETVTTDASGAIDILYRGPGAVGDTVYVLVLLPSSSPSESLLWTTTVQ